MTTQEKSTEQADAVMRPYLAEQEKDAQRLKNTELRQARFMHYASIVVAFAYAFFVVSRVMGGKSLDALAIIVLTFMVISVISTRRRYVSAKASQAAT